MSLNWNICCISLADFQPSNVIEIVLQRLSRLEEEARTRVETKKRKFFADILNAARELQLQVQAAQKRRKQRNDGVQVDSCFLLLFPPIFTQPCGTRIG